MRKDISKELKFFEGEPLIKNSHLITHILVYNNEQIILFSNKAFYVYSYQQMLRDEAALANIVEYQSLFKLASEENNKGKGKNKKETLYHMDEITEIFNNPHDQDGGNQDRNFGDRIFANSKDINTNILLQGHHFINRLTYLNSIKVKTADLSSFGDLLINFVNGQSFLVRRNNSSPYYKNYQSVDLTSLTKKKVSHTKFIERSNNLLVICSDERVIFFDYLRNTEISSHKYSSLEFFNQIHAFTLDFQEDQIEKIFIVFQHPQKLIFHEFIVQKKKLTYSDTIELKQHFIEKIFPYLNSNTIYISTASNIIKVDLSQLLSASQKDIQKLMSKMSRSKSKESQKSSKSLQKTGTLKHEVLHVFQNQDPQQMLYINHMGDFFPKCKNTTKQYLNLVAQTTSGIFVGVTCKKQGNYKEGQLLIGFNDHYFNEMIRNCGLRIKNLSKYENLNFEDLAVFAMNPKLKKQIIPKLSKLFNESFNKFSQHDLDPLIQNERQSAIQLEGVDLNQDQFEVLFLNLGCLFESKQSARQKIIQKRLLRQMSKKIKQSLKSNQSSSIKVIKERCIFTFKQIGDEDKILQCTKCDLYGVQQNNQDPNIWEDGLRNGFNRCYVCLNEMKQI